MTVWTQEQKEREWDRYSKLLSGKHMTLASISYERQADTEFCNDPNDSPIMCHGCNKLVKPNDTRHSVHFTVRCSCGVTIVCHEGDQLPWLKHQCEKKGD